MSDQPGSTPREPSAQPPTQPAFPQYPQQYSAPPIDPGYGGYGYPGGFQPPRNSRLAIASLVLGIVSLPTMLFMIGPVVALVGLILGIIGIAGASRKNLKRTVGVIGIVLSAIGLVLGSMVVVATLHAAKACKDVPTTDRTAFSNCIQHNLKL